MSLRRSLAIALTASVTLAGLVTVTATGASGATPAAKLQPRAAVTNTSVMTTVKTFLTGAATGVAVNAVDDSIYVTSGSNLVVVNGVTGATRTLPFGNPAVDVAVNQGDDTVYALVYKDLPTVRTLYAIRGSTDDSSPTSLWPAGAPTQVAVNQIDDTVYVTKDSDGLEILPGTLIGTRTLPFTSPSGARGVAVNDQDDTVYVTLSPGNSLRRINGVTDDSQATPVGVDPWGVGVNQGDDTVYVMNNTSGTLSVINGATGVVSRTVPLSTVTSSTATGVAVDQLDDTVYVTSASSISLWILNGGSLDDSTSIKTRGIPVDVAVDDTVGTGRGLVYVATSLGLEVVARATPVLNGSTTTGTAGATVTVDVSTAPTPPYGVDSNLVASLRFNGSRSASASPGPGAGQWSALLPSGLPTGPVTVEAVFGGGNLALAGTYTVQSSGPPPSYPPDPPTSVSAVAGDAQATVSWTAPSYAGSFPITDYMATSSPGGWLCIAKAPATSCTVSGLTNGVSYTFTAQALNGAGWSQASLPSSAVTPRASSYPPGAPTSVSAVAGDARATVSWTAPSYAGTSPITDYEVVSSPDSQRCVVAAPATTCTVSGLTNGTSYTFTARAINAVGWGEASQPSNAVTPQAPVVESISIVGSRDEDDPGRVRVSGSTVGLVGQQVTPYVRFPGQTTYTAGVGTRTVDSDGTFEWQRKTGKKIYVYFAHGNIRSTIAIIAAK